MEPHSIAFFVFAVHITVSQFNIAVRPYNIKCCNTLNAKPGILYCHILLFRLEPVMSPRAVAGAGASRPRGCLFCE